MQKDFAIRKTENPGEEELRDLSKEDSAPKDLYKKAQDVLNRMSNYSEEHLQAIVDMIFEKARLFYFLFVAKKLIGFNLNRQSTSPIS